MTDAQKKAAAALSLTIVTLAVLFLVWLTIAIASGKSRGDEMPGSLFMLAISSWGALALALKALPGLVSIGLAVLGAYKLKDPIFYAIVVIAVVGLFSSIYLLLEVGSEVPAQSFWAYSPTPQLQDYESFVAAAQKGLGIFIAWFVIVISVELGIKKGGAS